MNPNELAQRLRNAREQANLSQQAAADAVNLSRTAITQIEGGNRSVSTFELMNLAKLYRRTVSYFLDNHSDDNDTLEALLYRAAPGLSEVPVMKNQIDHYIDLCREGLILEKLLEHNPRMGPPIYSLSIPTHKGEAALQGESVADQERKRMGIGSDPIADIAELIAKQAIWVSSANLPDTISGFFLHHSKTGLVILVNALHLKSRKRFSYAHEYAHALLDRNVNVRISSTANHSELIEIRANAFAAAFLMPKEAVIDILQSLNKGNSSRNNRIIFDIATEGTNSAENRSIPYSQTITYQDATIIAHHFGVSYQAATYRLRNLGYISAQECDALIKKESDGKNYLKALNMYSDLESREEEKLWDRELRSELVYLAIEAFRREEISRGRIIELGDQIGIGGKKLYELAQATLEA
jgi:Zn-dependent peptidase ImmA (M78 family)/transcriptional regulator with XRE-family HTH domain